jgi:hypothetical protein
LVSVAASLNPDGSENEDELVPCLFGSHPRGATVLIIPEGVEGVCRAMTGRVGNSPIGRCTVLEGLKGCERSYNALGIIGVTGRPKRVGPTPIVDEATRRRLEGKVIGAAESARAKWKEVFVDGRAVTDAVNDAVAFPGLDGAPRLARLTLPDAPGGIGGPWVTERGRAGPLVGPYSMGRPEGFVLEGKSYVRFGVAACTECGGVGTEVYRVEGVVLRQVLVSYANSN